MKQYYLGHQLKYRHDILKIQKDLEFYFGIRLINPFYDIDRPEIRELDSKNSNNNLGFTTEKDKDIVYMDLSIIDDCDGLVCILLDHEAIGSFMEIFYAWNELDLPVYLICSDEKIRKHPWIVTCCYKIFSTVDEFKEYLKANRREML